jgi:hypothetical protein
MIRLTRHAAEAMEIRSIALAWIEATLRSPDWSDIDPRYPDRHRSFKAIDDFGGRVLRVVYRLDGPDIVVITVHPDRNARP